MEFDINFVIPPTAIVSGLATILFLLVYNKQEKGCGLSVVVLSDAIMSLLSGAAMALHMLRTVSFCDSTNIMIQHSTVIIPLVNGLMSMMSWNYQCWQKLKSDKNPSSQTREKYISILPQYVILSLVLIYLSTLQPQTLKTELSGNKSQCSPNVMLSYLYRETCANYNSLHDTNQLLNRFLSDLNKSRTELLFSENHLSLLNDTEEIVQKVYGLVNDKLRGHNNDNRNDLGRTPRKSPEINNYNHNLSKFSANHITDPPVPSLTRPNIYEQGLTQPKKIFNGALNQENCSTSIGSKTEEPTSHCQQKNCIKTRELKNITNTHANDNEQSTSVNKELQNTTLDPLHYNQNRIVNITNLLNNELPNVTAEQFTNAPTSHDTPVFKNNLSAFYTELFMQSKFNNKSSTLPSKTKIPDYECFMECSIQNDDEKLFLMILLLVCYFMPICTSVILYNKAAMEAMLPTLGQDVLLRSARWGMALPLLLTSPGFLVQFIDTMLCTSRLGFSTPMLTKAVQILPVVKNTFNMLVIKRYTQVERSNKVHPIVEESSSNEAIAEVSDNTLNI